MAVMGLIMVYEWIPDFSVLLYNQAHTPLKEIIL